MGSSLERAAVPTMEKAVTSGAMSSGKAFPVGCRVVLFGPFHSQLQTNLFRLHVTRVN